MKFVVALIVVLAVGAQARVPLTRKMSPIAGARVYPEPTIIGGSQATQGQFPHQAAVLINGRSFCGGSLITTMWVMTAAHCVDGSNLWEVTLGAQNQANPGANALIIETTDAKPHEEYGPTFLRNDIAVINLGTTVVETEFIKVVNLPTRSQAGLTFEGVNVVVSGWGKTSDASTSVSQQLNFVGLRVISNDECAAYYSAAVANDLTVCCLGRESNESTCNGDSGGPLILDDGAIPPTQVGVVSFVSSAGCESGAPSGYERTGSHLDWLALNTDVVIRP